MWTLIKRMMGFAVVSVEPKVSQDAPIVRPQPDEKTIYYRRYIIPKEYSKQKIKPLEENIMKINKVKEEQREEYYRNVRNSDKEN